MWSWRRRLRHCCERRVLEGYAKRSVMWMRPVAKMASARSMYWVRWMSMESARCRWKSWVRLVWLGCCWATMASQQPMAAPTPTSCCRLRMGSRLTRLRGRPYLVAASFSCCVVTLLVCSSRMTSFAASWMVGSKVVTHCWISGWFQPSGISSCSVGCGGCKTSVMAGGFGGGGVGA